MNRADRGSLLLIVAGGLLVLAIVAYLINEAEDHSRHAEATYDRQALEAQARRAIEELRVLRDENDRIRRDGDSVRDQHEAILKSLERIEKVMGGAPAPGPGRRRPGSFGSPARASGVPQGPALRADLDRRPF